MNGDDITGSDIILMILHNKRRFHLKNLRKQFITICDVLGISFNSIEFYDDLDVLESTEIKSIPLIRNDENKVEITEQGKKVAKILIKKIQPTLFCKVVKLKEQYNELTSQFSQDELRTGRVISYTRPPKLKAYRLLEILDFNPGQSVAFFKFIEASASEKAWAEDIFFAYYNIFGLLHLNPETRSWCKIPYPGYPGGWPNFGKKPECPPQAPLLKQFLDLEKPHFLAIHCFDLGAFSERMLKDHPGFSEKQARNPRFWQKHVYSMLKLEIGSKLQGDQIYTLVPEAMGVNVFDTLKDWEIPIMQNPDQIVFKVAVVGTPLRRQQKTLYDFVHPGGGPPG
ncbi:MAG: hypothetical protein HXS54_01165 [Theionarchaea archaeon]|nr:hypothetical protein [Theionarchaea archaeon]